MIPVDTIVLAIGTLPAHQPGRTLSRRLQQVLRDGGLPPGELLPGARTLAAELGIARGTVTSVLDELCDVGLLDAEPRRGHRVADRPGEGAAPVRLPRVARGPHSPGVGDLRLFPRSAWTASVRHAIATIPTCELGYPDPAGLPAMRTAVAQHLTRMRGAHVAPDQVMVVSGVAHAQSLIAAVARRAGLSTWYVEDPQPPSIRSQLLDLGCAVRPMTLDEHGARPDGIDGPGVVLLTPSHQAPTGLVMSGERRRAFVAAARSAGAVIVEDDYDGELPLTRERRPVLQATDPSRVILVGSVSKTLAPALALGWVCAPTDWHEALVAERALHDHGSPVIDQAAFAHFLESGGYGRHLRRVRVVYAQRRDALVGALARHGLEPLATAGSTLQVCLSVPPGRERAAVRLHDQGVPTQVCVAGDGAYLSVATASIALDRAAQVAAAVASALSGPVGPGRGAARLGS